MERTRVMGRRLATIGGAGAIALGLVAVVGVGPAVASPVAAKSSAPAVIRGNLIGAQSTHLVSSNGFGLPSGNGFLSVFQTIPNQTLTVTVGSGTPFTLSQGDFNFGGIAAGTYPVTTSGPSGSVTVPASGNVTSLIYLSATGTPTISGFLNDLSAAPSGQSRMVFRNTAQGGPVDISVNGTTVATSLTNSGTSSTPAVAVNLPPGP